MSINLNHPIVASMVARKSKFLTDAEMMSVLGTIYGGDVPKAINEANRLALSFVVNYSGSFSFIHGLKPPANNGAIPALKLKGVLNVIRKDALEQKLGRKTSYSRFNGSTPAEHTTVDLGLLAPGEYTVKHKGNDLVVLVQRPGPESKWDGWIFLAGGLMPDDFKLLSPQQRPKLGSQRPGKTVNLTISDPDLLTTMKKWVYRVGVDMSEDLSATAPAPAPAPKGSKPEKLGGLVPKKPKAEPPAVAEKPTNSVRDRVRARYHIA